MSRRTDTELPELPSEPPEAFVVELDITSPSTTTAPITGPWQGVRVSIAGTTKIVRGAGGLARVEVQVGDQPFEAATSAAAAWASWTFDHEFRASGSFTITARAVDAQEQVIAQRAFGVTVALDPAPSDPPATPPPAPVAPTIAIEAPADGASVTLVDGQRAQLTVTGRVSAPGDAPVQLRVDGQPVTAQRVGETFSATIEVAGSGAHGIEALVRDAQQHEAAARVSVVATELPTAAPVVERLMIVEKYKLSTFQSTYGYGPTIKMVSLLPGQKTTVNMKLWDRRTQDESTTASILESGETHVQDSFEQSLSTEQTTRATREDRFGWDASVKAGIDFGVGTAGVQGSVSGGMNATREENAKQVASALAKHTGEASAKRQIEAKTSQEMKREEGEEYSDETHIENINLSRTLNYVFWQMNQEYVTLLQLVDVGVVYVRADEVADPTDPAKTRLDWSYREVSLSQLDPLLRSVIVPGRVADVRRLVLEALAHAFDYQDEPHQLYEERDLLDSAGHPIGSYLRFPKGKTSTYSDPSTGTDITVPGVILAVMRNTMRTDGIACDAWLGEGEALDEYNRGLQDAVVAARQLENARAQAAIDKDNVAVGLVRDNDADRAAVFSKVYPVRAPEGLALTTVDANGATHNGTPTGA